jgi:hypothetical protein
MLQAATARCRIETKRRGEPAAKRESLVRHYASLRVLRAAVALLLLAFVVMPSLAADERPAGGRVPTVTRLVALYLDLETEVNIAIRNGDGSALGNLLTDDFELRAGNRAAAPVPRAEWIREVLRTHEAGDSIEHMAVHDYATVAVVSFTMNAKAGPIFVIDVWRVEGPQSRLAVRYASPAGTSQFAIPGAGVPESEIPKKF